MKVRKFKRVRKLKQFKFEVQLKSLFATQVEAPEEGRVVRVRRGAPAVEAPAPAAPPEPAELEDGQTIAEVSYLHLFRFFVFQFNFI